ncbi:Zinc finger CCCH domain-containing protein 7 [Linum perenne]
MDPRLSYYHSTRYASSYPPPPLPLPPPPPPPPPHDNPNFFNLPPPPPYPPPPSQTRFIPQFPVVNNPNLDPVRQDYYPRSLPEHPGFHPVRLPEFDCRDLPRVSDDGRRRGGEYPAANFEREVDMHSMSAAVRIRSELVVNSRFLEDVNRRSEYSTREGGFMGQDTAGYHRGHDQDSRDYRVSPHHDSSSRGFDSNPVDYERRRDLISDYGREVRRDVLNSMVEMGNKESRDYQYRIGYNCREANAGLERHNDNGSRDASKGSREDSYEFNRTPKKKKSAFLRIQKPIVQNKEDLKMHFSGYYDADDKPSIRGKDQSPYSGRGTEDKAGGGIPVELDVSFKSNSLVAKAVVTPPSTSVSSSNADLNPRKSIVRKLHMSEKDSPPKSKRVATRLNSVVVKNVSSSCTDLQQSKEKVTASTTLSNLDSSSVPGNGATSKETKVDGSGENNASDKGGCCLISGKRTLAKVAKKKKAIKIVVKKSEKANAAGSSSQPAKLPVEPTRVDFCNDGQPVASGTSSILASVKANGSDRFSNDATIVPDHCLPMSSECVNYTNIGSVKIGDSQLSPNDLSVIPENDKLEIFEKDLASDEPNSEENFVQDASVGMQLCQEDLSVMPENDKLEKSKDAVICEKPNSDENFLQEVSAGSGGSEFIMDDLPIMPENDKLATLEQDMLPDKPNFDANFVHDALVGTGDGDSQLCLESDQPSSNEHFVPDAADKICDSLLCPENSKLETLEKAMISDKPNSGWTSVCDASIKDSHVPVIGSNLNNLPSHSCVSAVPSVDNDHGNLSQNGDADRTSPQVSPSEENADFDSNNLGKKEILKDPISTCNKDVRIDGCHIHVQEGRSGSDITVNNPCKRRFSELRMASRENVQNPCSSVSSLAVQCSELFVNPSSDSMGVEGPTASTSAACCNPCIRTILGNDSSFSNHGMGGDIFEKSTPNEVSRSFDNSALRCVNNERIVNEGVNTPNGEDGRKIEGVNDLCLSMSEITDTEPAIRHSEEAWVDTTLRLSFNETMMDPKEGSCVDLPPGIASIDSVQLGSSVAVSKANTLVSSNNMVELDQTSPQKKKKRKLSTFEVDLSFSMPSQVKDQDSRASIPVAGVEWLSGSCNDPTKPKTVAPSFMGPLCTLKGLGSHHGHNGGDLNMGVSASATEMSPSSKCSPTSSNVDIRVSSTTAQCTTDLLPGNLENVMLVDSHPVRGCFVSESSSGNIHHEHQLGMAESVVHKAQNILSAGEAGETADAIDMNQGRSGIDSMDIEIRNGRHVEMEALDDQVLINDEIAQNRLPSKLLSPVSDDTLTASDIRTGPYLVESNLPSATLVMTKGQFGNGSVDSEISNGHEMEIDAVEDQVLADNDGVQNHIPLEFQTPVSGETLTAPDTEIDMSHPVENILPSLSNHLSLSEALNGQVSEILPEAISVTSHPQKLPDVTKTLLYQNVTKRSAGGVQLPSKKPAIREGFNTSAAHNLCSQNTKSVVSSDKTVTGGRSLSRRPPIPVPKDSQDIIQKLNGPSQQSNEKKNQPSNVVTRTQPLRPSFGLTASSNVSHLPQMTKRRTWLRNDSSTAPVLPGKEALSNVVIPTRRQFPKNVAGSQSMSYVRKGNSLVRKPSQVSVRSEGSLDLSTMQSRLNSSSLNAVRNNTASDSRAEGTNSSIERPRTPPLPVVPKVPHRTTNTLVDHVVSPVAESLSDSAGAVSDPLVFAVKKDIPKPSDRLLMNSEAPVTGTAQAKNMGTQIVVNESRVESSAVNITYVKRKSNQLVATSSHSAVSAHGPCNTQPLSSKSYYKRRSNQLVRAALDGCIPGGGNSDDSSKVERHSTQGMKPSSDLGKRQLHQVVRKIKKPAKYSLVWTLSGTQSSKDTRHSLHRQRILPNLFPWKRATYRRNSLPSSFSSSIISSVMSKKLLPLRTHDTIYKRSKHGFSLIKSKVLSVGGSSLKWSKSIQSRSKKVNEEATLAVAAADKKKREQKGVRHPVSGTKNKNSPPNEALPCADVPQTVKDAKKPYVPRRLTIGKDEYVRIGNGNKLIRNPKKRSRILASEKVRWSLHTARSRLAKKRKYCQFFTRFGKCNKDDGKCPYIHDPSKIAVCTKFLQGLCSNHDCKLTHKVIPERMPDCSFYLQGLCTNKRCSYRHVHVNPKASTCEGFLKGYCADGNECQKRHSYACPSYEATGSCPQGSKCKLHHPKNRVKGKKPKRPREKNHGQGRYFGAIHIGSPLPERHTGSKDMDRDFSGNEGDDFISLGISDEDEEAAGEEESDSHRDRVRVVDEQLELSDGEYLDESEVSNLDKLIMPVRIMNI